MLLGWRTTYLVAPLFVAASLLITWPALGRFNSAIPVRGTALDPPLQAFLLGWDWRALAQYPSRLFSPPIFHPEPRALTYMDHMVGETVAAAPAFWATGSLAAAYNWLVLLAFTGSAWATYRLVRLFAVPRSGAFLGGFLYAFSPYIFANLDLLNQLQAQFLPLGLFFGVRYLQSGKLRHWVAIAGTWAGQVYFGWYYAYYLTIALALLMLYALAGGYLPSPRPRAGLLATAAGLALLAVLPVTVPYVIQRVSDPWFQRTLGEAALYSADLLDYVAIHPDSLLAPFWPLRVGPQSYWPGLVAVGLAVIGARRVSIGRLGLPGFFLLLAPASLLLSLGPVLQVAGQRLPIPLPYAGLYFLVPGLSSMRAPGRLAVVTLLAVVVLASFGFRHLHERYARRGPYLWRGIVIGLFVIAGISACMRPVPLLELPTPDSMPPVYRWLAARATKEPLLEFPVPARDAEESALHSMRQLYALYHGHPRIDGCSGFVSPDYRAFRKAVQDFPEERALRAVSKKGARHVVVHYADYSEVERRSLARRIADEPRLLARARFGDDAVYELAGVEATPTESARDVGRGP